MMQLITYMGESDPLIFDDYLHEVGSMRRLYQTIKWVSLVAHLPTGR